MVSHDKISQQGVSFRKSSQKYFNQVGVIKISQKAIKIVCTINNMSLRYPENANGKHNANAVV